MHLFLSLTVYGLDTSSFSSKTKITNKRLLETGNKSNRQDEWKDRKWLEKNKKQEHVINVLS